VPALLDFTTFSVPDSAAAALRIAKIVMSQ
jgi:hypothetical protein